MVGSTSTEALDSYARLVQAALHCVTAAKTNRPAVRAGATGTLLLGHDEPVSASRPADRRRAYIGLTQRFRVVEVADAREHRFRVLIEDYEYKIFDSRRRELFVFHWHPESVSEATWPHVHVGSVAVDAAAEGMEVGFYERFSRLHIPTGMLAVEQVVRFLITELHVTPLRADWDVLLQEGEALFQRHQPWMAARNA